jgi:hypothetical protein
MCFDKATSQVVTSSEAARLAADLVDAGPRIYRVQELRRESRTRIEFRIRL